VADVWSELFKLHSSHVRARTVTTWIALATTRKNQLSIAEYYSKMQTLADNMMSIGSALRDDEFVSYILAGLDEDYNAIYSVVITRVEPITPSELYAQLLSYEQHLQLQHGGAPGHTSSANSSSCGRGMSRGRSGGPSRGRGRGRSRGASCGDFTNTQTSTNSHPQCQVCLKIGHTAAMCWYRFDEDYVPEPRTATTMTTVTPRVSNPYDYVNHMSKRP
jgi:hypothetical protein